MRKRLQKLINRRKGSLRSYNVHDRVDERGHAWTELGGITANSGQRCDLEVGEGDLRRHWGEVWKK